MGGGYLLLRGGYWLFTPVSREAGGKIQGGEFSTLGGGFINHTPGLIGIGTVCIEIVILACVTPGGTTCIETVMELVSFGLKL